MRRGLPPPLLHGPRQALETSRFPSKVRRAGRQRPLGRCAVFASRPGPPCRRCVFCVLPGGVARQDPSRTSSPASSGMRGRRRYRRREQGPQEKRMAKRIVAAARSHKAPRDQRRVAEASPAGPSSRPHLSRASGLQISDRARRPACPAFGLSRRPSAPPALSSTAPWEACAQVTTARARCRPRSRRRQPRSVQIALAPVSRCPAQASTRRQPPARPSLVDRARQPRCPA